MLDRNPEWKRGVAATLRSIVRDIDALEMFCETGLPREFSFLAEAVERVMLRLLPDPSRADLGTALAARMHRVETREGLEELVDKIVQLLRSQIASIFGNVALVVAGVVLVAVAWMLLTGAPPLSPQKAAYTLAAHGCWGRRRCSRPSPACCSGCRAWPRAGSTTGSCCGGSGPRPGGARRPGRRIAGSRRLAFVLGRQAPGRIAAFLKANISGLAGDVALGVLLGLTPELLGFVGLPVDVRHVTLSTGQVAAAVASVGPAALLEAPFWLAAGGSSSRVC